MSRIIENIDRTNTNTARAIVISDPVTGQPLMLRSSAGMNTMYVQDGTVGAPIALITTAARQAFGYDYDPYGVPVLTQNSGGTGVLQKPYTFGGTGLRDRTTDWVHYYHPRTSTFTQQDTLDAPLDPLNANRYAYAGGDPTNNIDPTGESACRTGAAGLAFASVALAAGTGPLLAGATVGLAFEYLAGVGGVGFAFADVATERF